MDAQSAGEILAARVATPAPPPPPPAASAATPEPAPEHKEAAEAGRGAEAIGKFLSSRQGKQLQKQVMRGVFGLLKKQL